MTTVGLPCVVDPSNRHVRPGRRPATRRGSRAGGWSGARCAPRYPPFVVPPPTLPPASDRPAQVDIDIGCADHAAGVVEALLPLVEDALRRAMAAADARIPGRSPAPAEQQAAAVTAAAVLLLLGLEDDANARATLGLVQDLELGLMECRSHAVAVFKSGATHLRTAAPGDHAAVIATTHRALVQLDPAFAGVAAEDLANALWACSPSATKGKRPGAPGALARVVLACGALQTPGEPMRSQLDAARKLSDAARLWRARVGRNEKRRKVQPPLPAAAAHVSAESELRNAGRE